MGAMRTADPLRIWHLIDSYPPAYGGGANLIVQSLCQFLASRGHEIRVLCTEATDEPPFSIRTDYDGSIRVDRVNMPYFGDRDPEGWRLGWLRWRAHERKVAAFLDEQVSSWRPDLAHYHVLRPLGEQCLQSLSQHRIPIVSTAHDGWLICPRMYLLRSPTQEPCDGPEPLKCLSCIYSHYDGNHSRALLKLPWRVLKLGAYPAFRLAERAQARKLLSGVTVYAKWLTEAHRKHVPGRVEHIPIGIEMEGKPATRPARPRQPLRFGFVAGFQPHKGIDHVLAACVSLKRQGLDFELHIWGPGESAGNGVIASKELADRLTIHGLYAPANRWQVYSHIDVMLMATTVVEPFGLVVQEARATGAPTIAPAIGGLAEQIRHGVDGLLYRFRDPEDLERQMLRILVEPKLLPEMLLDQPEPYDRANALVDVEAFYRRVLTDIEPKARG